MSFEDIYLVGQKPPVEGRDFGAIGLLGGHSSDDIRAALEKHHPLFIRCFEWATSADPKIRGRVALQFVLSGEGKVVTLGLGKHTTLKSPDAIRCILNELQKVEFPHGDGSTLVGYPLMFAPEP